MFAVQFNGNGTASETLSDVHNLPIPSELGPTDILVRNYACAVNPIDCKVLSGGTEEPKILGFDGAGVVSAIGSDVDRFKVDDEVMYAGVPSRNGSNAQYTVVDSRIVGRKPQNASFSEAAALPLVSLTVWEGFYDQLRLLEEDPDVKILIINGAGGVGSIGIQVAKQVLKSNTVIATASRPETIEFVESLGADHVINHRNDLREELAAIGIESVDAVFCAVDLDIHFDAIVDILTPSGRVVGITIGDASKIDVSKLFFPKRLTLSFELMFSRPLFDDHPEKQGAVLDRIAQLYEDGEIKSIVYRSWGELNAANLAEAHELQSSGKSRGKLVLEIK
eukprot:TRINITY_DN199_c0_g1_i2.p1 TRINITY_DN199_c0_g1~~TRINITY_DN199_c0_g1_i2.p1  ORF type:complete len:336 (+),score=92.66 TRINITY_DN199_c0_g1_i2:78-1085(+)